MFRWSVNYWIAVFHETFESTRTNKIMTLEFKLQKIFLLQRIPQFRVWFLKENRASLEYLFYIKWISRIGRIFYCNSTLTVGLYCWFMIEINFKDSAKCSIWNWMKEKVTYIGNRSFSFSFKHIFSLTFFRQMATDDIFHTIIFTQVACTCTYEILNTVK